ncbi:hypothetical protein V2J09_020511 [Rumex salicifolius]
MASQNGSSQLSAGLLDHPATDSQNEAPRKRRFRRCRSAPMADNFSLEEKAKQTVPHSQSVFSHMHPSLRTVAMFLIIYLGLGTVFFYMVGLHIQGKKTNGIVDALYFCVVTMTTVGYGDLVPDTVLAKLLACAFVFAGVALVGLILSKSADYLVEKQEALLVRALHVPHGVVSNQFVKEIEVSRVKYKCLLTVTALLMLMFIGTAVLYVVERKSVIDAFYCVCCTITTLGYGDHSFSTEGGRIFAVFWILTSTVCLGQFFFYIAELNSEFRQRELVNWVMNRRVTHQDLEAADLDNDGVVDVAEFVLYKLKEMGKISNEDISMVMAEFEDLDVDQSGTLSVSDISLAQSDPPENTQNTWFN